MANKKEIDCLKEKKNQAIDTIGRISRFVLAHKDDILNSKTSEQFLTRKELLQEAFQRIQDLHVGILCLDKKCNDVLDDIEEQYLDVLAEINEFLSQQNANNIILNNSGQPSGNISTTKLPPIDIPTFDGKNLTHFKSFIDIFSAVIDKNSHLKDVEKLFYLRNYTKNEASALIKNLPLVNSSYKEALKILNDRYNNETMIINSHIQSILDLPSIQKGTASALREFVSHIRQQIGALKNLNQPVESWNMLMVSILLRKLDQFTNRSFQIDRDSSKLFSLDELLSYLDSRAVALETSSNISETKNKEKTQYSHLAVGSKQTIKCSFCSVAGHKIYNCKKFKSCLVNERISFVNKKNLCKLCLNSHASNCKLSFKCSICQKDHNSLLHLEKQPAVSDTGGNSKSNYNNSVNMYVNISTPHKSVLLPTVKLKVKTKDGKYIMARGLVDTGSQISLITGNFVKALKLKPYSNSLKIIGISETTTKIQKSVDLTVKSLFYDFSTNIKCCIVDTITSDLPNFNFDISEFELPKNVQLSDDSFNKVEKIDILLGADVSLNILLSEKLTYEGLILQNTLLGYIVGGYITSNQSCNLVTLHSTYKDIDKSISRFWETEKVPEIFTEFTSEHEACEIIFKNSLEIVDNKYQVRLPLKQYNDLNLGDSFSVAFKRFENLEKRFSSDHYLFTEYKKFIEEYLILNHAQIVDYDSSHLKNGDVYFMAHHPVIREDKKTTKLRVVFDGGMKSKSKKCINDFLYNGAVVQNELFDILVLFRTFKYVILSDIKQMYRMILVHPDDRKYQNILWRNLQGELQTLQLQTVTYGLRSSSFLATRCLVELAHSASKHFPLAAQALLKNTYVDDILSGADTIEETIRLKNELISILNLRSFSLHKWCSNEPRILNDIPKEKQNFNDIDLDKNNFIVKTLGLSYNTSSDTYNLSSPKVETTEFFTKRQILSFISKFYDPLGLAGPLLVSAKVIMQRLWILKLKWDEIVPADILKTWQTFIKQLTEISVIEIPRNLYFTNAQQIELIGFCDSSIIAYGASIYARTICSNNVNVNLICSKSRIATINKKLTIPRLELNGALLLAGLVKKVHSLLESKIDKVFLYSDSSIVLAWLKSEPLKLNAYVANRVIKIKRSTSNFKWLYISSHDNPADCLSRGLNPQDIHSNDLWFHGPERFSKKDFIHKDTTIIIPNPLPEEKVIVNIANLKQDPLFEKYSCITYMQRVFAYILRFNHNTLNKSNINKYSGNLKSFELENALKMILKYVQRHSFSEEIKSFTLKLQIKSSLKSLAPFLDGEGLLRVGGRLQNSNMSYNQRHPIILPKENHITHLLIRREHLRLLHAGPRQVLSSLNLKFWLINCNREIKKVIHKCVICFKHKAKCSEQLMGSLPEKRVCSARVFQTIGIDFCGPFFIKQSRLRKSVVTKAYISLFVCFSVKAIHMELLSDLTTDNFLAAFKRFISRRGKPLNVYCDNGSTFKGANNQLKELYKQKEKIENFCSEDRINFNFIPSYSPVFGGLWEAGVKSAKFHIKRVVGKAELTYEQFNTVVVQVEGILNSRPLSAMSRDPLDLEYLTPGHFLIGTSLTSFPEPDCTEVPQNKLKFWKICTQMQQHFWKKWQNDYLTQLQSRPKWKNSLPNLQEGMLVLLKEDNTPSFKWPIARIVKTIPGKDGKVRVVEVRTKTGIYLRSVTKIAILPINE